MSGKKKYPVRIPRFAPGIRSQDPRGGASRSWWSKRWLAALETMGVGGRLARGRSYAVSGQVVSLRIAGPRVEAQVVGARSDPYAVAMDFSLPDESARDAVLSALRADPMLIARLFAGDLPMEVEEIFRRQGMRLFPGGRIAPGVYDVMLSCSCPDWANPCKHTCAVMLILGEEIARRPMTLLEFRGIGEGDLCDES